MAAGIFFILLSLLLIGIDLYRVVSYEHVDATLAVHERSARVTYEFDDGIYQNIGLSSYNALTMKDGKTITVLVSSKNPGKPYTTSFVIEGLALACGIFGLIVGIKSKE